MSIRNYVQMFCESNEWRDGQINYTDCPECGRVRKLMVIPTDEGTVVFRCLRVDCGVNGHIGGSRFVGRAPQERTVHRREPSWNLLQSEAEYLHWRVPGLGALTFLELQRFVRKGREGSFLYQHEGPDGVLRAETQRWYDGREPKTDTHPYAATGPLTAWVSNDIPEARGLVIVEDIPSALSLAYATVTSLVPVRHVVALAGTALSISAAREIRQARNENVMICLDSDATNKAAKLRTQFQAIFGCQTRVVPLQSDLKDMFPGQLEKWWETVR